jgi:hypothetical protein
MKNLFIIAALLAWLVGCKKQDDDYVDLKDQVLFTEVRFNVVPTYERRYKMLSGAQRRIINGETEFYRTPYFVYTNKEFQLNTYYKAPLDKSDSLTPNQ